MGWDGDGDGMKCDGDGDGEEMGWDGMGWDGMGWDGMRWDGMEMGMRMRMEMGGRWGWEGHRDGERQRWG